MKDNPALNLTSITNFFKTYCSDMGISIEISNKIKCPKCSADGKIYLPTPSAINALDFWGGAYHEAGHLEPGIRWTMDFLKEIKTPKELAVYNILIDYLSEMNMHGYYRGRDSMIYESSLDVYKERPDFLVKWAEQAPILSALLQADMKARESWQGAMPCLEKAPEAQPYYLKIKDMSLGTQLSEILETKDKDRLRKLAQAIINLEVKDEQQQESGGSPEGSPPASKGSTVKDEESGGSGGKGEAGKTEEPTEDQRDSEQPHPNPAATPDPGKGQSQGEGGDEGQESGGQQDDQEGCSKGSSGDTGNHSNSGWGTCTSDSDVLNLLSELGINTNPSNTGEPEVGTWDNADYIPCTKIDWKDKTLEIHKETSTSKEIKKAFEGSSISHEISKYLRTLTNTKYQHGLQRGRVSSRSLHRIGDSGTTPPRIFKKREQSILALDTAVSILVDCSGSMTTQGRYIRASACAVAIATTLGNLRIPCEVLGFTEDEGVVNMFIFKKFSELSVPSDILSNRFGSHIYKNFTPSGESLLLAAERLMGQRQNNKMLISLTDGMPEGNRYHSSAYRWYLKEVAKIIEASQIHLYGVGISSDCVSSFFTNNCVVKSATELDSVLLPLIKDVVLKENRR